MGLRAKYDNKKEGWLNLELEENTLVEGRLQLHYAAQVVSSIGSCILPQAEDWSNTALLYDANHWCLRGMMLATGYSSAVLFETNELALISSLDKIVARTPFAGHDMITLLAWLQEKLLKEGVVAKNLQINSYPDFPHHPIADGAFFSSTEDRAIQEIGRYYHNSFLILETIQKAHSGASHLLIWPHHFDMATLITLRPPSAPGKEDGSSVGAGFSPGDEQNEAPYWYVTPWPYPAASQLPPLPAGKWNTEGWVGAKLFASDLRSAGSPQETLSAFLASAVDACVKLL